MEGERLQRDFFQCKTTELAKKLIGTILVHKYDGITIKCKIVETEAYLGVNDSACHTYKNLKTERTKYMYNDCGFIYVFSIH